MEYFNRHANRDSFDNNKEFGLQFKNSKRRIPRINDSNNEKSKSSLSEKQQVHYDAQLKPLNKAYSRANGVSMPLQQCFSPIQSRTNKIQNFERIESKLKNSGQVQQQYVNRRVKRQLTQSPMGSAQKINLQFQVPTLRETSKNNYSQRFATQNGTGFVPYIYNKQNRSTSKSSRQQFSQKNYSVNTSPEKNRMKTQFCRSQKHMNQRQASPQAYSNTFSGNQIFNHFRNRSESYQSLTSQDYNRNIVFSAFQVREFCSDHGNNQYDFSKKRALNRVNSINSLKAAVQRYSELKISQFQLGLCCAQDIFGKTYPARHIETGLLLCIKIINKKQIKNEMERFIQCVKIQSFLSRPQLVQIYSIFCQHDKIYLLMEYHDLGPLFLKMKAPITTSPKQYISYFYDICCAVNDFHLVDVVCRNLKPENISLVHNTCKIANFSYVNKIYNERGQSDYALQYCPLEVFDEGRYSKQSEIWVLGILLYEMATGISPCHNLSKLNKKQPEVAVKNIQNICHKTQLNEYISKLLFKILLKEQRDRLKISKLIKQVERTVKFLECSAL